MPKGWPGPDGDELSLPDSLKLVAARLPAPLIVLDFGVDADGYLVAVCSREQAEKIKAIADGVEMNPRIIDGEGVDPDAVYATVAGRLSGVLDLEQRISARISEGMASREFTVEANGTWVRPLDLPRTKLRVWLSTRPLNSTAVRVRLHVGVGVERAVIRPHIPDDVAAGWLDDDREPRDAPVRPFLDPDYLHPSYSHEQSPAYFGLIATEDNWESGVDEYVFETIDRYLPPILAALTTADGLPARAPGPHLGNVSMPHLMRTSVLILAVMGRSDLVETAWMSTKRSRYSLGTKPQSDSSASSNGSAWSRRTPGRNFGADDIPPVSKWQTCDAIGRTVTT